MTQIINADCKYVQDRARAKSKRCDPAILATVKRTNGVCGAAWWPTGKPPTRRGTATSRNWYAKAEFRSTSVASSGRSSAAPEVIPNPEVPSSSTPTTSKPLPLVKRFRCAIYATIYDNYSISWPLVQSQHFQKRILNYKSIFSDLNR